MVLASWILYTAFGFIAFALGFLWAVRGRQFHDQRRARHLPLEAEPPEPPSSRPASSKADLWLFGVVGLGVLAMLATTVVASLRAAGR